MRRIRPDPEPEDEDEDLPASFPPPGSTHVILPLPRRSSTWRIGPES
jgi:hypothetical protein